MEYLALMTGIFFGLFLAIIWAWAEEFDQIMGDD
jgi:hypothetical protein